MQGRRIPAPPTEWDADGWPWARGDYWKNDRGGWEGCTPNGLHAGLRLHVVEEHADGTITVSPSIFASNGNKTWHGYIRAGVWESC